MKKTVLVISVVGVIIGILFSVGASFADSTIPPQTGQTVCYDMQSKEVECAGSGQDGDTQAGVEWPWPRFKDNGDGTITDNLTGLMWLAEPSCVGVNKTWQEAFNTISDFNTNPNKYTCTGYTAKYTDWTLPNVNELESLMINGKESIAEWLMKQGFKNIGTSGYATWWSSTTYADGIGEAWVVGMDWNKAVTRKDKSEKQDISLFLVRSAQTQAVSQVWQTGQKSSITPGDDGSLIRGMTWPSPRFTDNGDGTITDNMTGLMWLKNANCFEAKNWQAALDVIADFNLHSSSYGYSSYTASYSDWRLPNEKELHSLIDYSQTGPALQQGHPFINVRSGDDGVYWSSTSDTNEHLARYVSMISGKMFADDKSDAKYVWPVRSTQLPVSSTPVWDRDGNNKWSLPDIIYGLKVLSGK